MQLAVLISQIKVNSMAVVHMKSPDACEQGKHSGGLSPMDNTLTNQIEQVLCTFTHSILVVLHYFVLYYAQKARIW